MPTFSIIVPVFNRPDEIDELLQSLTKQTYSSFEVLIVEDGSTMSCEEVVGKYQDQLSICYFFKENTGQGFSRNYGSKKAKADWLVFFDSDCVIPADYFQELYQLIRTNDFSAFCGPDGARNDFSQLQRAISYSMTSVLTTGGIRGKKVKVDKEAHLRSYNLVMRKDLFDQLGGFAKTNMGEDMELSFRFRNAGFKALISDSIAVFHKRRNTLSSFYKQVISFGRTRIQLKRDYGIPIKLPHLFPAVFVLGLIFSVIGFLLLPMFFQFFLLAYGVYFLAILLHATFDQRNLAVGLLSLITSFLQHSGYGMGFMAEWLFRSNK